VSDQISELNAQKVQEFINLNPEPWSIPQAEDIEKLVAITSICSQIPYYHRRVNYTFSAASNAIRFLRSLQSTSVQNIREIVLIEDRESIAYPECHIRGLIPFCQANPDLRVHRYACLWTNVLPVRSAISFASGDPAKGAPLYAQNITRAVARWMVEAAALYSLTMPHDSFTLTFDGNPVPEESSKVFDVVLRDAAWQSAMDECYSRGWLPSPSWFERRRRVGYIYEDLPQILKELTSSNRTSISCNFVQGHGRSVESIVEECEGYTLDEWKDAWSGHSPTYFQTVPPLPPWHILRAGNDIPKGY
jgi:hypothetical protein